MKSTIHVFYDFTNKSENTERHFKNQNGVNLDEEI